MEIGMILFLPEMFRVIPVFVMSAKSNSCVITSSDRTEETDMILHHAMPSLLRLKEIALACFIHASGNV